MAERQNHPKDEVVLYRVKLYPESKVPGPWRTEWPTDPLDASLRLPGRVVEVRTFRRVSPSEVELREGVARVESKLDDILGFRLTGEGQIGESAYAFQAHWARKLSIIFERANQARELIRAALHEKGERE